MSSLSWGDCHAKLMNSESLALARAHLNGTQHEIVLYLLAETRGTPAEFGERATNERSSHPGSPGFGRESYAVYRGAIAKAINRDVATVKRALRGLIARGIVVEQRPGGKGRRAQFYLNLDGSTWGSAQTPDDAVAKTPPDAGDGRACGGETAPSPGGESAPLTLVCGGKNAPRFREEMSFVPSEREMRSGAASSDAPLRTPSEIAPGVSPFRCASCGLSLSAAERADEELTAHGERGWYHLVCPRFGEGEESPSIARFTPIDGHKTRSTG